jgi:hypothetical protein
MNVQIKVLDLPELAAIFGQSRFSFSFPGDDLAGLLQALAERYGEVLKNILLDSDGQGNPAIRLIVRGRLCAPTGDPVALKEGDQVAFVVFLEGG